MSAFSEGIIQNEKDIDRQKYLLPLFCQLYSDRGPIVSEQEKLYVIGSELN